MTILAIFGIIVGFIACEVAYELPYYEEPYYYGEKTPEGCITFSDELPNSEMWRIYVSRYLLPTSKSEYEKLEELYIMRALVDLSSENLIRSEKKIKFNNDNYPRLKFFNGAYTIIIEHFSYKIWLGLEEGGLFYRYITHITYLNDVIFNNGNATISYGNMETVYMKDLGYWVPDGI
jgi:hypothetical protein